MHAVSGGEGRGGGGGGGGAGGGEHFTLVSRNVSGGRRGLLETILARPHLPAAVPRE